MKADLHCHSSHSKRPSDWVLQKIGSNESYTKPVNLYKMARARGMDAVTITDHNTIDGCLEISHLPDTFISCEYTTYFTKTKCKIHTLCWGITPKQHEEINYLREDIYDLIPYLRKNNILHGLAHPLYSINSRLNKAYFKELMELFDRFELNGAKDEWANEYLLTILDSAMKKPYSLTGGSDDHSGLTLTRMHTVAPGRSVPEFLENIRNHNCHPEGRGSTPHTLARNIYSIGLQYLESTGKANGLPNALKKYLLPEDYKVKTSFTQKVFNAFPTSPKGWGKKVAMSWLKHEFDKVDVWSIRHLPIGEQWTRIMEQLTDRHLIELGNKLLDDLTEQKVMDIFTGLGRAGFLYALLAPYIAAYQLFSSMRNLGRDILSDYRPGITPQKIVKFTDNFGKVDGVSKTLKEMVDLAQVTNKDYRLITCLGNQPNHALVKDFVPVGVTVAPEYSEQPLVWPPFLAILDYCFNEGFTHVQAATPGPMGLAGMAVAKIMGAEFQAVYHTEIPQFISQITEHGFMVDLAWRYCTWFYDNADKVFAPSEPSRQNLVAHGLSPEKVRTYPRGIDTDLFSPTKATKEFWSSFGVPHNPFTFLYVGRLSREKNLHLLVKAFRKLRENQEGNYLLAIVGDGDYTKEMQSATENLPVLYTGYLEGETLAQAFASADVFVFPSAADTHGRVILEAQASGLPCIVTDVGGPQENIEEGITGYVVPANEVDPLVDAMRKILNAPLDQMKIKAREHAEKHSLITAFEEYWSMY